MKACGSIMIHVSDIMSTSWDVQYIGVFDINQRLFINLLPHMNHDIPPMYSWYPPDVLMVSPRCTNGIPRCTEHTLYTVTIETSGPNPRI